MDVSTMLSKAILVTLLLAFTMSLLSCDPGIGVVISNKTSSDQRITAIYPSNFQLPQDWMYRRRDSLRVYEINSSDNYKHPLSTPILTLDTIARTYTFILQPGREVIVESRWPAGYPTFGQQFIINNKDTLELERHSKDFKKKPKLLLGGSWTHVITDER